MPTSSTLQPNQKSPFDIFSSKDNFDGMQNYELSLQWRDSDGEDQYVDNAQVYKPTRNSIGQVSSVDIPTPPDSKTNPNTNSNTAKLSSTSLENDTHK